MDDDSQWYTNDIHGTRLCRPYHVYKRYYAKQIVDTHCIDIILRVKSENREKWNTNTLHSIYYRITGFRIRHDNRFSTVSQGWFCVRWISSGIDIHGHRNYQCSENHQNAHAHYDEKHAFWLSSCRITKTHESKFLFKLKWAFDLS